MSILKENKNTQLWKINNQKSLKNGPHKTIYIVKSHNQYQSGGKKYKVHTKYKGEWKNDKKNGFGIQIFQNGDKYEGEWYNNKRHGKGTLWRKNNKGKLIREYIGQWKYDKKWGLGTMFFDNCNRYDGCWEDDQMSGYGRMVWSNKDIYIGMWFRGKRNGYGFLTKDNGDHFEGQWVNDQREGKGSYYFNNSNKVIIGEWVNDCPQNAVYSSVESNCFQKILDIQDLPILEIDNAEQVLNKILQDVQIERLIFRCKNNPYYFDQTYIESQKQIFKQLSQNQEFISIETLVNELNECKINIKEDDVLNILNGLQIENYQINFQQYLIVQEYIRIIDIKNNQIQLHYNLILTLKKILINHSQIKYQQPYENNLEKIFEVKQAFGKLSGKVPLQMAESVTYIVHLWCQVFISVITKHKRAQS